MDNLYKEIQNILHQSIDTSPEKISYFFKTQQGNYAEFDKFLGITMPNLRKIAKKYLSIPLPITKKLLQSEFNEERVFALLILTSQYKINQNIELSKDNIFSFYIKNIDYVNNWNLVDISAHHILGEYLWEKDRSILLELASSKNLWQRRIAIVATWYFIKKQDYSSTITIAEILIDDKHDLIHKACGWMMREVGKQNQQVLLDFLRQYCRIMPRTMLRYAIEKLPPQEKILFLKKSS